MGSRTLAATVCIFQLLLSISGQAFAADLEFKGIKVGQPFSAADRFTCEDRQTGMADVVCHLPYGQADSIAGHHAELVVYLLKQKVALIYLQFSSEAYEAVKAALSAKYGTGKSKKTLLQNGLGAVFENETTSWTKPEGMLSARRYTEGSIKTGAVIMQSTESLEASLARRQQQEKQNSSDL